ncbi:MAG TPA: ATP-binding protein [Anaeromyxobacter sp.]|nr:ATP-binding protein [Anaeromyxobacter sp.]
MPVPVPATFSRRLPVVGYVVLAIGLVAAFLLLDRWLRAGARRRAGAELEAVASLKVSAIASWRAEHLRNVRYAAAYPVIALVADESSRGALDPALATHVSTVLGNLAARQGYPLIAILRAAGSPLAEWRAPGAAGPPFAAPLVSAAIETPGTPVSGLHDPGDGTRPTLDVALAVAEVGRPPVVVALRAEMEPIFSSVLEGWPVPADTAGTSLVRADGDEVLLLGSPQWLASGQRGMRIPMTALDRPAVQAALGVTGVVRGVDQRGHGVLAAICRVPDADWRIITKMDLAEIDAPLVRPLAIIGALVAALLLAGGVMLAAWWRHEAGRVEIEERLRESRDRLHLALAGTHFVWDWDLQQGRLEIEAGWSAAPGRGGPALEGGVDEILARVVDPADLPAVRARAEAHLRGETPLLEVEFRPLRTDGREEWHLLRGRASRRDPSGRALRMSGVVSDVTERRTLGIQLERSERMASLGTLAAGVAHEVNNPLASVLANLEYLEREAAGRIDPGIAQVLRETRDGAARVRDVVRGLRTFSRPGSGRRAPVDVRAELEAAVRLTRNELRHHAHLELALGSLPTVVAGEHELGQVFLNLLLNAAQAIPEGQAEENLVEVTARTDERGWAKIEVRDTGSGIPPDVLPRIFEPFFSTKEAGTGTGLGLAIAHSIVAAAGGRIEVDSQLWRGSTFRVLLPPAPVQPEQERPVPPPTSSARRRVLVVDDDPLVARAIVRTLGKSHEVETVAAAAEALARLDSGRRYDAILCDLMMPQMTGMELHERLASGDPDHARRMIFVTGGAFTERAAEFLRSTPNPCLEKPFDADVLRLVVERAARAAEERGV